MSKGPYINYVGTYGGWGGGGGGWGSTLMHTNEYKGEGGSDHDQNTHFVRRFIENATISEPFKELKEWSQRL